MCIEEMLCSVMLSDFWFLVGAFEGHLVLVGCDSEWRPSRLPGFGVNVDAVSAEMCVFGSAHCCQCKEQ